MSRRSPCGRREATVRAAVADSRSQDHQTAASLVRDVDVALARDFERLLTLKDVAHYGDRMISSESLVAALRCARRLVESAKRALEA